MLEIAIIVSIALALFLLLRNFPKTNVDTLIGRVADDRKDDKMFKLFKNWTLKKKQHDEEEIKKAIKSGQAGIVSPREIKEAQHSFLAEDPEVAKLLFEANEALGMKDFNTVEEKSLKVIAKDKKCDQAYAFMALVALERKDYTDAEEACKIALQCNRDSAMAHAIMGQIDMTKERYSSAINEFQKAVSMDRNNADWQASLGKTYLQVRQFSKAAKALKRASSLDIDNKEYRELAFEAEEKQRTHARAFGR